MPQIADTGYLIAFWSKADAYHQWARGLSVKAPLRTCEAVLTEMLVDGDLVVDFDTSLHAPGLLRWLKKYADLDPGFADACVVRLAELCPRAEVLTTDRRDFTTYRTLTGRVIRCRFPE